MNPDDVHKLPLDHPARLLMIAHKRLSSAHPVSNGTKSVVVAAYGDYVVRLMNVPTMTTNGVSPRGSTSMTHSMTARSTERGATTFWKPSPLWRTFRLRQRSGMPKLPKHDPIHRK